MYLYIVSKIEMGTRHQLIRDLLAMTQERSFLFGTWQKQLNILHSKY